MRSWVARWPLREPLANVVAIHLVFRLAGLAERTLGHGWDSWTTRLARFAAAAAVQVSLSFAVAATLLPVVRTWRRARVPVLLAMSAAGSLLMLYGEVALQYASITGQPLTLSLLRTYASIDFLRSHEFLDSIDAHQRAATVWLALWLLASVAMVAVAVRSARGALVPQSPPQRHLVAVGLVALGLVEIGRSVVPQAPPPPELALARELFMPRAAPHGEDVAALRALVGLPPGARWVDDAFPLVYAPAPASPGPHPPDVFVLFVESLRAADEDWVDGGSRGLTPHLDALARRGVSLPHYISNAYPSAPSFFALHCSAWPHESEIIMGDFPGHTFDALPARLRDLGYHTVLTASLVGFRNQEAWLGGWYDEVLETARSGGRPTDKSIFELSRHAVEQHDAQQPGRPLFEFVVTTSTHLPFARPSDDEAPPPMGEAADDPVVRYHAALRYTDRQVGAFVDFLDHRARRDDTVVWIVGDHAFPVRPGTTSDLATDDFEWVSAVLLGPERLVGPARRIEEPASHVDVMPTMLAMVGDDRPSSAIGADLLGAPRGGRRQAVAVRTSSVRIDRAGETLLIDTRAVDDATITPSFGAPVGPTGARPFADDDAHEVTRAVRGWSALVEADRVFSLRWRASQSVATPSGTP